MAVPTNAVIEAIDDHLKGWDPANAMELYEAIQDYSLIGERLRRVIMRLANFVEENRTIEAATGVDLVDMAAEASSLYDTGQTAFNNFWDNHKFWLERDEGS